MKDINLDTLLMRVQYAFAWISFILFGTFFFWLLALFLSTYGKDTSENKERKKDILNKSYQKLIFWYGSIVGDFLIIVIISFYLIDLIKYLI